MLYLAKRPIIYLILDLYNQIEDMLAMFAVDCDAESYLTAQNMEIWITDWGIDVGL